MLKMLGNQNKILKDRKSAKIHFRSAGSENPVLEAKILSELITSHNNFDYDKIILCLDQKKPIQYLAGYTYVKNKKIMINENVLLPGPEMDLLIDICANYIKPDSKVLDLCTGSGVIPVILSQKFYSLDFYATDISEKALSVAKKNAELYNLDNICFLQGDLFQPLVERGVKDFDLLISNPPYCKTDEIELLPDQINEHAPRIAIDGGIDGLIFHRQIINESPQYLKKGGYIILENENGQSKDVQKLLNNKGHDIIEVIKNHMNQERLIVARLNYV